MDLIKSGKNNLKSVKNWTLKLCSCFLKCLLWYHHSKRSVIPIKMTCHIIYFIKIDTWPKCSSTSISKRKTSNKGSLALFNEPFLVFPWIYLLLLWKFLFSPWCISSQFWCYWNIKLLTLTNLEVLVAKMSSFSFVQH